MRRATNYNAGGRGGFTLVELLVVILIIAILASLTAAAAVAAIRTANQAQTRAEISQLAAAITAFKQQYGVQYIPSTMTFPLSADANTANFMQSVWPRLDASKNNGVNVIAPCGPFNSTVYWGIPGNSTVTVSGDQILVLMLGGRRDGSGACFGFASNGANPMDFNAASSSSVKSFFDFPVTRLRNYMSNTSPSFIDNFGSQPYLYFSSQKAGNDYPTFANGIVLSVYGVYPYQVGGDDPTKTAVQLGKTAAQHSFANRNSFQIISAGLNEQFGDGGIDWVGGPNAATPLTGADDMANFHPVLLGIAAK